MPKTKKILSTLILLCAQFLISCQSTTPQPPQSTTSPTETPVSYLYPNDTEIWQTIFSAAPAYSIPPATQGAILPHHMIVDKEISKFYQGLQSSRAATPPSQIILIGPNHYQAGQAHIQTCQSCIFQTPTGPAQLNTDLINQLITEKIATPNDPDFPIEHSLHNHTPFIKKFFPQAQLTPIMLKWETTPEETEKLADFLHQNTPPDTLIIASVDFSHYIPAEAANFHDISSFATIHNFDYQNVYDLEVDSPPSLSTILHLMEKRNSMKVTRLAHTNNQDYRSHPINSTTSHQFISFSTGPKEIKKDLTITVLNLPQEIQEKTKLTLEQSYRWDITEKDTRLPQELQEIRGQEDRFLVGSDFLVVNIPPGCHPKQQNGLKITFCNLTPETLKTLESQKKDSDYLYLQYPTESPEITKNLPQVNILITPNSPKIQAIHISPQGIEIKELSPKIAEPQPTPAHKG